MQKKHSKIQWVTKEELHEAMKNDLKEGKKIVTLSPDRKTKEIYLN